MIKKLHLKNFKCFECVDVEMSNLNVLTGINGMGKSTIMQSILLLIQSAKDLQVHGQVLLNGEYVKLGNGKDVLYEAAEDDSEIVISVETTEQEKEFRFQYEAYSNVLRLFERQEDILDFCAEERNVYLSAYRIPPAEIYSITNDTDLKNRNFGADGLYALQYLKEYGPKPLQNVGICGNRTDNTLYEQVRKWMNEIAPGVSIEIEVDTEKRLALLGYSFVEGKNRTNTYNCVNVGFGITYVLPVVVALLSAKEGDLILLENPEAHIHPAGQRKLGELIALVANCGVQIIVETHSDHILNGIRIAVKNKMVRKEEVNLLYFYKDEKDGFKHKYESPEINEDGRINKWPRGFFDAWEDALLELL